MGNESSSATTVITPTKPAESAAPEQPAAEEKPAEQPAQAAPEQQSEESIDDSEIEEIRRKRREQFKLRRDMKRQEFMALRNANTMEDSLECMNKLGRCVNNVDPKVAQQYVKDGINGKVLFVICNTYNKPQYSLGVGPLNDAITVALGHKKMGYQVLYLHNSTPTIFKKWLKFMLKNTTNDLTIFYTGHGCSIKDKDGDESDGYDEVMLFDNGYVTDDELCDYLTRYAKGENGQRIVLLTDCCHSGSMWDIQSMLKDKTQTIPKNIISVSSAKDDQTAKQTKIKAKDQGIFTYYFWELLNENPALRFKEMESKINPLIGYFKQHFTVATTTPSMLEEEIFPDRERKRFHRGRRGGRGQRRRQGGESEQ
ncbi:hypothetical protein M9Y10_039536 [Tritrichomonas musculus]|uniref:Peptidase C14 caspase domain-containing protein n=1 Tax=Tritrichomonas musculus TaxID=1915356 RepID=A0ABR2GMB3_9EUKA